MRRWWLSLLLLVGAVASAQTPQVGATLGLNQTFTAANTFTLGVELGPYTVSQLSTLTGLTNIIIVSDGTPGSSPCTGGGTGAVAAYYNGQWNCVASGSGGGDTITSPNTTITVGGSSTATTLDINLAQTNTWTGAQTFGTITPATISGAPNFSAGFRIEGSTIITSASSANSQAVICATGGTGTQVCDASGAWIAAGAGTVTSFAAPSVSWPTWLVPTVTNSTTTPSLAVAASAIPNSALANAATTVNGQTCTLGSTCTISTGSGTVTSFSAGNLSPLFTTSVATATTTPALTFSLTNAAAGTVFGNATGSAAGPSFSTSEVLGTTGQSSTSTLTMYGSTASSNLAPPYISMCAETGSTCAWLYPSTSFSGGFGINSSAPTTDIATPHVLYAPGGVGPVYITGTSSTTGLLQCPVAATSNEVTDCGSNATIFYGVAEGTGNSNTRLKSYGVVTVNIPSSTTTNGDYICSGTLSAATYNAVDNGSTKCPAGQQVGFAITKNASAATSVQVQLTSASGISGGTGTVTSITAGTGLSGGTITTSGTIALSSTVPANCTASNVTGQSTSQSSVSLCTSSLATGQYFLRYYADQSTVCTTGSNSVSFTFNWTDVSNARVLTTGSLTFTTTQATNSYLSGSIPIYVSGSAAVTYTSTVVGTCATGTSTYDMHAEVTL
jgi:hypothetical protein